MKVHVVPCRAPGFGHLAHDEKTFEVRLDDGRRFAAGDGVLLREIGPRGYTGRAILRRVKYVLDVGAELAGVVELVDPAGAELDDPLVVLGLAYPTDDMITAAAMALADELAREVQAGPAST